MIVKTKKRLTQLSITGFLFLSVFVFSYFISKFTTKDTRFFSKADSPVIWSDNFTTLSNWTLTGTNLTIGQSAIPNYQFQGKTTVKLTKNSNDAICLTRNITPSTDLRVSVQFYDDYNPANPPKSVTTGTFISLRNTKLDTIPQVTAGVRGGKYLQTINKIPTDFYFLRLGNNSYPTNSGLDPDSNSFIKRTAGWHTFELVNTPYGSYVEIDKYNTSYLPGFNGISKGFTKRVGMADQISICNTWSNGTSYYADLSISSPAVLPYPGTVQALYNPVYNYISQYSAYTTDQISQVTVQSGWYAKDGFCRIAADDAASATIIWKKTGATNFRDRAISSLKNSLDLKICYPYWQAGVTNYNVTTWPVILSTWFLWNDLDTQTKQRAYAVISNELDYFSTFNPANRWSYDSAAEENSWIAQDLWFGYRLFSGAQPNASLWKTKADIYAFHSLTTGESYAGITTQTLEPGYYVQNHGVRNNDYQLVALGQLGNPFLLADRLGGERPLSSTFNHNVSNTWNSLKASLDPDMFLGFTDSPAGTWPVPPSRGNKDEYGTDPYSEISALYYLQKYNLSSSVFDNTLRQGWYMYNDFTVLPIGGTNCTDYANNPCTWRYPGLLDLNNLALNDFNRQVLNAAVAGERFAFTAAIADTSVTLPLPPLNINYKYSLPPAIPQGNSIPISDNISKFVADTKISNYRAFHFNSRSSTDLLEWADDLSDGKILRFYFFDTPANNIGMNLGWQTADKTAGLAFQIKSLNDDKTPCITNHLKENLSTQCYVIRTGSQNSNNETPTQMTRANGWQYVDLYRNSNNYFMNINGVKIYTYNSTTPLTSFFLTSSNWSIPTTSDFIVTKIDTF